MRKTILINGALNAKIVGQPAAKIAEVAGVTVEDRYMDENGKFRLSDAGLVAYSHGEYYELGEKVGSFGYSVRKKPGRTSGKKRRQPDG